MMWKYRSLKLAAVVTLLAIVAALAWTFAARPTRWQQKLPDGTVMRVERVSFGRADPNYYPWSLPDRVKRVVSAALPKRWSTNWALSKTPVSIVGEGIVGKVNTNQDALHVWLTRRDATNGFTNVGVDSAELVDRLGFVYRANTVDWAREPSPPAPPGRRPPITHWNFVDQDISTLTSLTFEAFPRHEREFRLWLHHSEKLIAELVVENPAPEPPVPKEAAPAIPVTNRYGDLEFVLQRIDIRKLNGNSRIIRGILPVFEVREAGMASTEWQALDFDLSDGSGNRALKNYDGFNDSLYLSPAEKEWRLAVKLYGGEHSGFASNMVAKIKGIQVPGPEQSVALDGNFDLGVNVQPLEFIGLPVARQSLQVALSDGPAWHDRALTIRAVDKQGREFYAARTSPGLPAPSMETNGIRYVKLRDNSIMPRRTSTETFLLNLPKDAQTVDLYFCVHTARTEEFVFRPPQ